MSSPLRFAVLLGLMTSGCAHHQLRHNTVHQAQTVSDVHTRQVLDNLAKFVRNHDALPHFSYPNSGATSVEDNASADVGFNFLPSSLEKWDFGLSGSRTSDESYTMTPVNDPEKLALMRCAYQRAVGACTCEGESAHCPNCQKRFNKFYLGSENFSKTAEVNDNGEAVFQVKRDVRLIYYPDPTGGAYCEFPNLSDSAVVVLQQQNDENDVVYTLAGVEGGNDAFVPDAGVALGTELFKLQSYEIKTVTELESLLDKFERLNLGISARLFAHGSVQEPDMLRNEIVKFREDENIRDQLEPSPPGQPERDGAFFKGTSRLQSDANGVYLAPPPSESEERDHAEAFKPNGDKKRYKIVLQVPAPLDASKDLARPHVDNTVSEQTRRSGKVTSACLHSNCWFRVGKKRDVPRECPCAYVGHNCGTYVWVPPCGRDELTKLTLAILDIAMNDAPSRPTTEVYAFLGTDGQTSTTLDKAAYFARATVGRGSSVASILPTQRQNAEPLNSEQKRALEDTRNDLREKFEELLKEQLKSNGVVYELIKGIEEQGSEAVDFVSQNYIKQSVAIQNGDQLIRLAAYLLALQVNEKGSPIGHLPKDVQIKIMQSARFYLNAEHRLQAISGVAPAPIGGGIVSPGSQSRPSVGVDWLRAQQNLRFLGGGD